MHDSSIVIPSRTARYSGNARPACRMNHTGVCGTRSPRAASRYGERASVDCSVESTHRRSHAAIKDPQDGQGAPSLDQAAHEQSSGRSTRIEYRTEHGHGAAEPESSTARTTVMGPSRPG